MAVEVTSGTAFGHLLVSAQRHARGVVVLDHRGSGALSANVEIDVADAAELTVVSIHDGDADSVHLAGHHARLGRDARLKHVVVTLGGDLVGSRPRRGSPPRAGTSSCSGCTSPTPASTSSTGCSSTTRCRTAAATSSTRAALQGDAAHTVWVGDVLIRAAADGTDTYELNRNLVLTDGARADSVPNLEIETGEIVGAGPRVGDGPLRRRAAVLPAGARIPEDEARRSSSAGSSPSSCSRSAWRRSRSG